MLSTCVKFGKTVSDNTIEPKFDKKTASHSVYKHNITVRMKSCGGIGFYLVE